MKSCYVCGTYEPIAKLMTPHQDLCENEDLIRQFVEKGWTVMPWVCSNTRDHTEAQCEDKGECLRRAQMKIHLKVKKSKDPEPLRSSPLGFFWEG